MSSVSAVNSLLSGSSSTSSSPIDISSILAATAGVSTPGIDVQAAVTSAIYAARAPERNWQAEQTTLASQTSALTSIQTATNAITTDLNSLNSLTGPLAARVVTSSDTDVTATAAAGTVAGVHTVTVNNIASTASWYSDAAASPTATLPSSSMTITNAAGATLTVATGTGQTGDNLTDLASAINNDAQLGITASIATNSGSSRLVLVSNTAASAGNFTITSPNFTGTSWTSPDIPPGETLGANSVVLSSGSGASLATLTIQTTNGETYAQLASQINSSVAAFNTTAATNGTPTLQVTASSGSDANGTNLTINSNSGSPAFTINEPSFGFTQSALGENANLTVDGVPVTSTTNTVTGVINGVTLNLLGPTSGTATLTVASDAGQVSTAINQFVTDYNTAIGLVNSQYDGSSSSTSPEGVLASDSTVTNLQSTLEQALNYVVPATVPPSTVPPAVSTLSDLGITMGSDGTLSVNSATLDSALTNNPLAVQNFFEGTSLNGFANSMSNALSNFTDPANGAFTVDLRGISQTNSDLTSQINDFETNYIATQQTRLTAEFSSAEIALQQLPTELAQIQAELGNAPKAGN